MPGNYYYAPTVEVVAILEACRCTGSVSVLVGLFVLLANGCYRAAQERKTENDPPGNYEGETAIHIAIVNHDFDMVRLPAGSVFHNMGLGIHGQASALFAT